MPGPKMRPQPLAAILTTRPIVAYSGRITPHDRVSDGRNRAKPVSVVDREHRRLIALRTQGELHMMRSAVQDALMDSTRRVHR